MSARRFERVEEWGTRPVDGLDDVRALADEGFTGAVEAGGTWAFFLNGRAVGVFGGELASLGDASGSAYTAPHPSLPLLLAMQERGGETQARYYTNETPLAEVDETLSDANFTGYVELSENVLSGDYYLVYHGGNSMSVAFVGASDEVVTDDEAFDLAEDEVGIYEVVRTDVDVQDVPAPAGGDAGGTAAAGAGAGAATSAGTDDASHEDDVDATPQTDDEAVTEAETGADPATESADDRPETAAASEDPATESAVGDAVTEAEPGPETGDGAAAVGDGTDEAPDAGARPDDENTSEPGSDDGASATDDGTTAASPTDEDVASADPEPAREEPPVESESATDEEGRADDPETTEDEGDGSDPFAQEAEWRETTSIPAVDPDETATGEPLRDDGDAGESDGAASGGRQGGATTANAGDGHSSDGQQSRTERQSSERRSQSEDRSERTGGGEESAELRQTLAERTSELETARERLAAVTEERDGLHEERDRLRERVEELRDEVSELRSELSAAQASGGEAAASETAVGESLDRESALDGTDLFVRYASRGSATLEDVADGADPDELGSNLRLDHHTQFDDEATTVDGEPYATFLEGTAEYGFVSWLVETLPFEIRDTAHEAELGDLYGALPDVDRADLRGTVDVETDDGTESRTFDVVVRDRMGNALVVADINDQRAPVSGEQMDDLVDSAVAVADGSDVAAAFYVTASFFEPDALEVADEETGGGFLSRDSRESFVKTGRKRGFHLCLVETRDGSFYLNVPEL